MQRVDQELAIGFQKLRRAVHLSLQTPLSIHHPGEGRDPFPPWVPAFAGMDRS
jgi:hypothetical protein